MTPCPPLPSSLTIRGLGGRRELAQWGPGHTPAAKAFLVYLKPTEQPIKSSIFRKRPLNRSIREHCHWTISSSSGGHLDLAGGHGPLGPPWLWA